MPPRRGSSALTALGVVAVIGIAAAFPVYYATRGPRISTAAGAMNADAAIRGAYVNAGSKDIGIDPNAGKYGRKN